MRLLFRMKLFQSFYFRFIPLQHACMGNSTLDLKSISHVTKTKRTLDRSRCGHGDVHRTKTKLTLFFIMRTRAVCSVRPLV